MSPAIAEFDMATRKITGNDFRQVRLLPVQLTQLPANVLQLKTLRLMSVVPDHELIVRGNQSVISAFMALQFTPDRQSSYKFLSIKYFAVDQHALTNGAAIEIEAYAMQLAKETHCQALFVHANAITAAATRFYRDRGYTLDGQALIKKI